MRRFLNRIWRLFEGQVTVGAQNNDREISGYSESTAICCAKFT